MNPSKAIKSFLNTLEGGVSEDAASLLASQDKQYVKIGAKTIVPQVTFILIGPSIPTNINDLQDFYFKATAVQCLIDSSLSVAQRARNLLADNPTIYNGWSENAVRLRVSDYIEYLRYTPDLALLRKDMQDQTTFPEQLTNEPLR